MSATTMGDLMSIPTGITLVCFLAAVLAGAWLFAVAFALLLCVWIYTYYLIAQELDRELGLKPWKDKE